MYVLSAYVLSESAASPRDPYSEYLDQEGIADPKLVALFGDLLDQALEETHAPAATWDAFADLFSFEARDGTMNLPHADEAIVEQEKVVGYLLNPTHPDNGGKAAFFGGLGFSRERWQTLARALRRVAATAEVTSVLVSPHGTKYVVDGQAEAPNARLAMVRTIWIAEPGLLPPRLVTAYPQER